MQLDLERLLILLQRRYHILKEIGKLTGELQEAVSRGDQVSASLVLQMRAEEIGKYEACQEEINLLAEEGEEEAAVVQRLLTASPEAVLQTAAWEEQKIYEVRQKTAGLIKEIQEKDKVINQRVGGEKSYYVNKKGGESL